MHLKKRLYPVDMIYFKSIIQKFENLKLNLRFFVVYQVKLEIHHLDCRCC